MTAELEIWTVYRNPSDAPDMYVARLWVLDRRTDTVVKAPTLDAVRALLPPGLVCLPRHPTDDPVIVETWM